MDLQGVFQWPGIINVKNARYTQTHGASRPDVITVECTPQPAGQIAEFGNAIFTYGLIGLNVPDCKVQSSTLRVDESSRQVQHIVIHDRRWRWEYADISGEYNVQDADGEYVSHIKKSVQELAIILFNAMGEKNVDVSGLPSDEYPLYQWICSVAANELDKLCDSYGCRVVLGYGDDPVRCVKLGQGQVLPVLDSVQTITQGVSSSDGPDYVAVCGDRILYDGVFSLEPVGEDLDGSIKHIDNLSYAPTAGWTTHNFKSLRLAATLPSFSVEERARAEVLAKKTVFRWFRPASVIGVWDGSGNVPYSNARVVSIDQFDLLPYRSGFHDGGRGYAVHSQPQLYGTHIRDSDDNQAFGLATGNYSNTSYVPHGFTIGDDDIVRLASPAIQSTGTTVETAAITYPSLYIRTGFYLRDYDTWLEQRWRWSQQVRDPLIGAGTFSIQLSSLKYTVSFDYVTNSDGSLFFDALGAPVPLGTATENSADLIALSNDILDAIRPRFDAYERTTATYTGMIPLRPDGLIRQVTYMVSDGDDGVSGGNCFTAASMNTETDPYVTGYRSRRRAAFVEASNRNHGRVSDRRIYNHRVPRKGIGE